MSDIDRILPVMRSQTASDDLRQLRVARDQGSAGQQQQQSGQYHGPPHEDTVELHGPPPVPTVSEHRPKSSPTSQQNHLDISA